MSVFQTVHGEEEIEGQCRELLRYAPGYRGYKAKDWRRREDKRLRAEVSGMLFSGALRLEAVEKEAYLSGHRPLAAAIAECRRRLAHTSAFMRSDFGASSRFFEDDIISAVKLRDVQAADLEIFRMADSIVKCISKLERSDLPPDERELRTNYLVDFIHRLSHAYEKRQCELAGG
jgi:hypothetical protein